MSPLVLKISLHLNLALSPFLVHRFQAVPVAVREAERGEEQVVVALEEELEEAPEPVEVHLVGHQALRVD